MVINNVIKKQVIKLHLSKEHMNTNKIDKNMIIQTQKPKFNIHNSYYYIYFFCVLTLTIVLS